MRFEPRLLIWSSTRACAPAPTATIVMTAATPMMMPSIVSAERSLLMRSAASAMRSVARKFMARPPPPALPRRGSHAPRASLRRVRRVDDQAAVAEGEQARGEGGDVVLVGDDDDGDAAAVELLQQRHHLDAGRRVERAGRLVGEDQLGIVDQRPRDGDALLLAAGELRRVVVLAVGEARPRRACCALRRAAPPAGCRRRAAAARRSPAPSARQQVELLEHEADPAVADARQRVAVHVRDVLAGEPVAAGGRRVEAADRGS